LFGSQGANGKMAKVELKAHQSKGVGRKLIEEACQLALKLNVVTMLVETLAPTESDKNYLKTYQFYESLGFKPLLDIKPEGYPWNMVYMLKQLNTALLDKGRKK
jgi:GNAT superfamily N-acetyltransferase